MNSGVGVTGLWRRPGPGMMASDVSVIKYIIKRVRFDLYKARYDRLRIPSVCDASCVRAHGPDQGSGRAMAGSSDRGVGSDPFYDEFYHTNITGYHTGAGSTPQTCHTYPRVHTTLTSKQNGIKT